MSVQRLLPIARKMSARSFSAYKDFVKNAKDLKPGEFVYTGLKLKNMTIVDTVNITLKDAMEEETA